MNSLLVLMAHPDDAELWAGGSLLLEADRGVSIHIIYFFELLPARVEEAHSAAVQIPARVSFLSTIEFEQPDISMLLNVIGDEIPDVVLTHWDKDTHLEHRLCYEAAFKAVHHWKRHRKITPGLLMCSTYFERGIQNEIFHPDFAIDIGGVIERKKQLVYTYSTQKPDILWDDVVSQNKLLGQSTRCNFAEGFKEQSLYGMRYSLLRPGLMVRANPTRT